MMAAREIAPAKLNLALHVRGKRPDGRHDIETVRGMGYRLRHPAMGP